MKLISMTSFILDYKQTNVLEDDLSFSERELLKLKRITKYAEFLKQPITLGMFVPCFDTGELFNKPFGYDSFIEHIEDAIKTFTTGEIERCKMYQEANEKVLFKDFSIRTENKKSFVGTEGYEIELPLEKFKMTIEYLANDCTLELTESALKQIGL